MHSSNEDYSLKRESEINSIKNDILQKYSGTHQRQTANIGPIEAQLDGPLLKKISNSQPIYSMSLKMTAKTRILYLQVLGKISGKKRIGPGKILKFLLFFYEKECDRRNGYLKNIYGYLDQISEEVSNSGFDPSTKSFSVKLSNSIKNLDSYLSILGFNRGDVREMITSKDHLGLFELYVVLSNHPKPKSR